MNSTVSIIITGFMAGILLSSAATTTARLSSIQNDLKRIERALEAKEAQP